MRQPPTRARWMALTLVALAGCGSSSPVEPIGETSPLEGVPASPRQVAGVRFGPPPAQMAPPPGSEWDVPDPGLGPPKPPDPFAVPEPPLGGEAPPMPPDPFDPKPPGAPGPPSPPPSVPPGAIDL